MSDSVANGTAPDPRNTGYALCYGMVLALGLPLNLVSLWILLRRHSLKSPSMVFMVNLAVSDLLLVLSLPMRIYWYATGTWPLGRLECILIIMFFRNNIRSSSLFITLICVDRLLAVVYPLRSRHIRTPACAWKSVLIVWLFVLAVNVPETITLLTNSNERNESKCFDYSNNQNSTTTPVWYLHTVLVLAMLAVNIVCTCLVSWTLRRHLNESTRVNNKINVMLIFIMNLIMFTMFFLPVSLVVFFTKFIKYLAPLTCLASVNCCLDPLLYYFSFDGFWKKKEDAEDVSCHQIAH